MEMDPVRPASDAPKTAGERQPKCSLQMFDLSPSLFGVGVVVTSDRQISDLKHHSQRHREAF